MNMFANIRSAEEPGSVIGATLDHIKVESDFRWNLLIGIEAALAVFIGVVVTTVIIPMSEAGLASLAIATAAIVPRVNQILRINRERIWDQGVGGWTANRKSIVSGTVILVSMLVVWAILASIIERDILVERFTFVGAAYPSEQFVLTGDRFAGHGWQFFFNNTAILILFFWFSFMFRSLGASLALGWNAGRWSITLVLLTKVGLESAADPTMYIIYAFLALIPHIILEGLAYIVGSLAGIFLSRGVTIYGFTNPRLYKVLNAVLVLAIIAFVIVIIGAVVENYWPAYILQFVE